MLSLKEPSLFLQVTKLLQIWDGLETDQLFFLSLSNHFRDNVRDGSHYLKQGSENRRFLILKWKSRKVPSSGQKQKLLLREKNTWWEKKKNDWAKRLWFKTLWDPIKRTFFSICLPVMIAAARGTTGCLLASDYCQSCYLCASAVIIYYCRKFLTTS